MSFLKLCFIPEHLLLLILQTSLVLAQPQSLVLNETLLLISSSLPSPPTFGLPKSSPISVSVSLCDVPVSNGPRFFVTNNTIVSNPGPESDEKDVFEIVIERNGIGNFTLENASDGGVLSVIAGVDSQSFDIGVSDTGPLHTQLTSLPLFGDSTANQVILFSPPFLAPNITPPTYPNYTVPPANVPAPPPPTQLPTFELILGPTSAFPAFDPSTRTLAGGFPITACALKQMTGLLVGGGGRNFVQESQILRDEHGWRTQWLVEGLQPLTNYTAYVVQDDTKVGGPINFVTKSAAFSCPLVHSLPFCPLTSYAVPLPAPPGTVTTYDASTIPATVTEPLLSYLTNFTTTLLTFACGRDWYSPLVTCAGCQDAYRTWLCAVSFPRCGEAHQQSAQLQQSQGFHEKRDESSQVPLIPPALAPQNSTSPARNTNLPPFPGGSWTALLPCLETCNAVDRACPNFLGFRCPIPRFNAADSYGVGYVDGAGKDQSGEWKEHGGQTGVAQDRWGNVWCNGPGLTV